MNTTMKKTLTIASLACAAVVCGKLMQKDETQKMLFRVLGEDKFLALNEVAHVMGDFAMWPIDFVRAQLP